jgi:pimeloyl-ACP methyl ester carboxylesterase
MPHVTDHHLKKTFLLLVSFLVVSYSLSFVISLNKINSRETRLPQELARTEGKFIQLGSANVYYEYYRALTQPAHTTILMVHGFGMNLRTWDNQIEYLLNKGYDLLLVDMLGAGLTQDIGESDVRAEAQSQMLGELMKYLAIPQTVIIGHSRGGNIAQRFALNFADKVQGLVLVNATDLSADLGYQSLLWVNNPFILQIPAGLLISKENLHSLFVNGFADPAKVTDLIADKYYAPYTIKGSTHNLVNHFLVSDSDRLVETGRITQPALVIRGLHDTLITLQATERILLGLPNREYAEISNAGHGPQDETPAELNQIIGDWLERKIK